MKQIQVDVTAEYSDGKWYARLSWMGAEVDRLGPFEAQEEIQDALFEYSYKVRKAIARSSPTGG